MRGEPIQFHQETQHTGGHRYYVCAFFEPDLTNAEL